MSFVANEFIRHIEGDCFQREHPITINVKDGTVMLYVPAGEFEMGDGLDRNCPIHPVYLAGYWIAAYCVSNAQYLQFIDATRHRPPDNRFYKDPLRAAHPVTDVSWHDAQAYARWAGCQLPTEAQWEKAARSAAGFMYPWGNDKQIDYCRNSTNRGNETTVPVYDYPQGVSVYGCYNQSGNVWEWCSDWYDGSYYRQSPKQNPAGPKTGKSRVNRGGCWGDECPGGIRLADRDWTSPNGRNVYQGFRLMKALA